MLIRTMIPKLKYLLVTVMVLIVLCNASMAQNVYPTNGYVGIGTTTPYANLHIFESSDSRPFGVNAPSKSLLKLYRAGTSGYSWPEGAEFRLGHGGSSVWGSRLDLYINGASNQGNEPDQHAMTWQYNGNVGIGTENPIAAFDVGRMIPDGALGIVFGRQIEGNTMGEGTFLGVRGWETAISNYAGKGFSLEHVFYGEKNSAINFYRGGGTTGGHIRFATNNGTEQMILDAYGNLGVGTMNIPSGYRLAVAGKAIMEEVKVKLQSSGWPDYVFKEDYKLKPLSQVEAYIREHEHLEDVPSAATVEKEGLELGANQAVLLKKIEELTLHLIEMEKKLKAQDEINKQLIQKIENFQQ